MVRNVRLISFLQETQRGPSDLGLGQKSVRNFLAIRPKVLGTETGKNT